MPSNRLACSADWTFELIQQYDQVIASIAKDFRLKTFPNQIEIISSEQMMDAYSSVGMPVGYHHWSFGKQFMQTQQNYNRGYMGLAYEIVINSNPCISYLMEENTLPMQALVIAHACYGHNSFFKNNYLFKTWTAPSAIIDYLVFAKNYVAKCEEKHGIAEVEAILDSCHALQHFGVDRYKRPSPISASEEEKKRAARALEQEQQVNLLWKTIPGQNQKTKMSEREKYPAEPEENILYFIEKNAPLLNPWQRELVRIVRKIAQYFYPQRQTQVMNEGWATFWHYTLTQELYNRGYVDEGFMLEFISHHTAVIRQPDYDSKYFSGINPYALGFAIFSDLRRICENPTEEDKAWFPEYAGSPWLDTLHFAMENFKDESFIQQFLSPKVIRDFHLFTIEDSETASEYLVSHIHDDEGYQRTRTLLSEQYNLSMTEPDIQIEEADILGDRQLTLHHKRFRNRPLAKDTKDVLKHLHRLWGFRVQLNSYNKDALAESLIVPPPESLFE